MLFPYILPDPYLKMSASEMLWWHEPGVMHFQRQKNLFANKVVKRLAADTGYDLA